MFRSTDVFVTDRFETTGSWTRDAYDTRGKKGFAANTCIDYFNFKFIVRHYRGNLADAAHLYVFGRQARTPLSMSVRSYLSASNWQGAGERGHVTRSRGIFDFACNASFLLLVTTGGVVVKTLTGILDDEFTRLVYDAVEDG